MQQKVKKTILANMQAFRIIHILAIGLLFSILVFSFFLGNNEYRQHPPYPEAVNGVIDLRAWDFESFGPVPLHGEWEFYWKQFPEPTEPPQGEVSYIPVPSTWNSKKVQQDNITETGYAAYRITVLLNQSPAASTEEPESTNRMGLRIMTAGTSMQVFAGNSLVSSVGISGVSPETSTAAFHPEVVSIPCSESLGALQLQANIANFDYRMGGMWRPISIGSYAQLKKLKWQSDMRSIILASSLFMMVLYHTALYMFRKQNHYILMLALFCLSIAIRALFPTEYTIVQIFSKIPFSLLIKIEYLSIMFAVLFGALFARFFFPEDFHGLSMVLITGISAVFISIVILAKPLFFTHVLFFFYIFSAGVMLYLLYVMIIAVIRKRQGAVLTLIGTIILMTAVWIDNLLANFIINIGPFIEIGMILFIFFQALALSQRLALSFSQVEKLSFSLAELNAKLEDEIQKRTEELHSAYESMRSLEEIRVVEIERKRLGRNLHDGLGQSVHALELISTSAVKKKSADTQFAQKVSDIAHIIQTELYTIIEQLYPVANGGAGLIEALRVLADQISRIYNIPVFCDFSSIDIEIEESMANEIYYILKEALHNAVRHAKPAGIYLKLEERTGVLVISVENDGVPGDSQTVDPNRQTTGHHGRGITIMKYRTKLLNGVCTVGRKGPDLFVVTLRIPIINRHTVENSSKESKL